MSTRFQGIFAALTTPFEGSEVAYAKFRENLLKYNNFDLAGYVVLGSTGESVYLSDEEAEKLVETAKEAASPEKKIIVGTARESTQKTLEFTNQIALYDVDAALVRTPSYFKSRITPKALGHHYLKIADEARIPIIIYNIPQYTGVTVDLELIRDLSLHPNISGLKDSSGNLVFLNEVLPQVESNFDILLGAGSLLLAGVLSGASGGILTLAGVVPEMCSRLFRLIQEDQLEDARRLQLDLVPLNQAVTKYFGVPGAKYALDRMGFFGGAPRLPLLPLEDAEKEEMDRVIDELMHKEPAD